ncbi:hypothetical protein SE92_21790 [Bradyrhizobium sp. AT1]|nr:hypothetical protein SE92_21790 [Bradyrhizobium sp. AT1]
MMIFARKPAADDIVLNLNTVYDDRDFMETVRATAERLGKEFRGINRWQGAQEEVVLKETTIDHDEIVSLGAFRQLSDVVPLIGPSGPGAPSDDQIFKQLVGKGTDEHFWTSYESAATGVRKAAETAQAFLIHKRLWPTELRG